MRSSECGLNVFDDPTFGTLHLRYFFDVLNAEGASFIPANSEYSQNQSDADIKAIINKLSKQFQKNIAVNRATDLSQSRSEWGLAGDYVFVDNVSPAAHIWWWPGRSARRSNWQSRYKWCRE